MKSEVAANEASVMIPLGLIVNGLNPRKHFDERKAQEMMESVKENGVIQPILVRPVDGGKYQLIAGERRYRASLSAGLAEIPAVVRDVDEDKARYLALVENIHRDDLSPTEEAERAGEILAYHSGNREETASVLCWDMTKLNRRLALLSLVPEVIDALNKRNILLGHAEILAACPSEKQAENLKKIIDHNLTVAFVRDTLAKRSTDISKAIFDTADCTKCQHNSTVQASLFETHIEAGCKCTNDACFTRKSNERIEAIRVELAEDFPTVRTINLGDNDTYVKLAADGPLGVGADQAASCKACVDYGAVVMAIPGNEGVVEKDVCLNLSCHRKKVLTTKEEAGKTSKKESGKDAPGKSAKGKGAEGKKRTQVAGVSEKVKQYKRKIHNEALRKEIMAQPAKAGAFLLSLILSGHQSYFQDSKVRDYYKEIVGKDFPLTTVFGSGENPHVESKADIVLTLEPSLRNRLAIAASGSTVEKIPEQELHEALNFFAVELSAHWNIADSPEFMTLLTKSEIESVAKEIGLDKAVKKFSALISGKKEETIKTLLSVPDFKYEGIVPSILIY